MRTYTQEEKQAVIDRVISGEPSAHILADTGIPKSTFYSWLRIYREEHNAANNRSSARPSASSVELIHRGRHIHGRFRHRPLNA